LTAARDRLSARLREATERAKGEGRASERAVFEFQIATLSRQNARAEEILKKFADVSKGGGCLTFEARGLQFDRSWLDLDSRWEPPPPDPAPKEAARLEAARLEAALAQAEADLRTVQKVLIFPLVLKL
jgi:hypothetical protein